MDARHVISIEPGSPRGVRVLRAETVLGRGIDEVFAFFAQPRNLERITPPMLRFRVIGGGDELPTAGSLIDYRLRIDGIPVRWRTRIDEWDPPHGFVDVQLRGPYRIWHHRHTFDALDDGRTRMRDEVRFKPIIGGSLLSRLYVDRRVRHIFEHRAQVITKLLDV